MIDLAGKRAFVTGGSRGIGRATAVLLARAGAKVAVGYRTRKPATESHITAAVRGDLGTATGANKAVAEALRALGGKLDILVINHGVWPPDDVPVAKLTDEQWESTRRANLDAVIYVCRAAIPSMTEGGSIVLVASTAGQRGEAFHADYAATKGAVISITKSLAVELAPKITVNCVAPGLIETEMIAGVPLEEALKLVPARRVGKPEEVAAAVSFLFTEDAAYITRQVISVNGGLA